jgi:hypothetical protein
MQSTWVSLEHGLAVVAAGLGCSLFLWFWMNRYLPKVPYFNRLIITSVSGDDGGAPIPPVSSGQQQREGDIWPAVGAVGQAVSELKPGGSAEFYDQTIADRRITSVISESGFVAPGSKIIVRQVAGNRVVVQQSNG